MQGGLPRSPVWADEGSPNIFCRILIGQLHVASRKLPSSARTSGQLSLPTLKLISLRNFEIACSSLERQPREGCLFLVWLGGDRHSRFAERSWAKIIKMVLIMPMF